MSKEKGEFVICVVCVHVRVCVCVRHPFFYRVRGGILPSSYNVSIILRYSWDTSCDYCNTPVLKMTLQTDILYVVWI